jgi:hypothetical protein
MSCRIVRRTFWSVLDKNRSKIDKLICIFRNWRKLVLKIQIFEHLKIRRLEDLRMDLMYLYTKFHPNLMKTEGGDSFSVQKLTPDRRTSDKSVSE